MYLTKLVKSRQTVFSMADLRKILEIDNSDYLKVLASRLAKRGQLQRLQKGIYVINDKYDVLELANKIKAPSYVSLETILAKNNVVFQDYSRTVFSVSNNTVSKKIAEKNFSYFKIDGKILSNPLGVELRGQAFVASLERAVCDRIYLSPKYYFDNFDRLDPDKLKQISLIYNKRTQKEVEEILQNIKRQK